MQNKQKHLSKSYLELVQALQALPQPLKINEFSDSNLLISELSNQLNLFKEAWPIIQALQLQGTHELIKILYEANDAALIAFKTLTPGSDLTLLIDSFLIKNCKELELVRRDRLTQFLLLPDLSNWLLRKCNGLFTQATHIMSYRFLLIAFAPCSNEINKLTELKNCITTYAFPLQLETLWAICKLYQTELANNLQSLISSNFLLLFNDLLNRLNYESKIQFIEGLPAEFLILLVELCLQKSAQNEESPPLSSQLLSLLCSEMLLTNPLYKDKLRARLQLPDLYLFDNNSDLKELAQKIITESTLAAKSNVNWIYQVFTLTQFIANCSPLILSRLANRYGLYFLTLNSAEYREFMASNHNHCAYMNSFHKYRQRIKIQIQNHPQEKNQELLKYSNLLQFGRERVIADLFFQLENQCQQADPEKWDSTTKALSNIHKYYYQLYPKMRSDILIPILNEFFNSLQSTNNTRYKEFYIYNSQGLEIGFILESSQAVAFVNNEVIPLIETNTLSIHDPVYTMEGLFLGHLDENGCLRSPTPSHLEYLASLSETQLEHAPMGLNLLLNHALLENALDTLYDYEPFKNGTTKSLWLEKQFVNILKNSLEPIKPTFLNSLAKHQTEESLFQSLAKTKNYSNAITLFHCILDNDKTRTTLLNGTYECDFQEFLKHHQITVCLANFMSHYYSEQWFEDILERFVFFANKYQIKQLFSDSLSLIEKNTPTWNALLQRLFGSETSASIVLKECLNDTMTTPVQQVNNPELNKLTQFVSLDYLTHALQKLNKTSFWELSNFYKLTLHFLNKRYLSLFPPTDSSLIMQPSVFSDLIFFTNRHLGKPRPLDKKHALGHKILGELIFSATQPEHIRVFFSNGKFNKSVARLSFTKPFLEQLLKKYWHIETTINEENHQTNIATPEIEKNQLLEDWHQLIEQTWNENNSNKLPGLCVFLLNYSGKTKPLQVLLKAYINAFQKQPEYLHALTQLLVLFPNRDFSTAIFDALEPFLITKPSILDATILKHMAQYYTNTMTSEDFKENNPELNLVQYWGHNQYYSLVQKACEELSKSCSNPNIHKRLKQGATEAAVENHLKDYKENMFFGIIKFFKRFLHYGFNIHSSESELITLCDDERSKPVRKKAVEDIKLPGVLHQVKNPVDFKEKRQQFVNLLHTIKLTSKKLANPLHASNSTQTLFISNADSVTPKEKMASPCLEISFNNV